MKSLSLVSTVMKSNFGKLDKPYKLNFSVTYMCQSRCIHCSIWQIHPKNEITLDEIKQFTKQNNYFKWVEITGGEPFLRSDIVEIVKAFYENSPDLYLVTMPTNSLNNYDTYMRRLEEIAQLGIPNVVVTVSLDGYRELEDKIRGVPGNYDKAIKVFKGIREMAKKYKGLYCVFGYTIINHNVGQLEKTIEEVRKDVPGLKYTDFHVNMGQISENYYSNSSIGNIKASTELALNDLNFLLKKTKGSIDPNPVRAAQIYLEIRYMEGLIKFAQTGRSPVPNRDGELSIFLDSYGTVYPSIMTTEKIGNIRENGNEVLTMLKSYVPPEDRRNYYTSCESYQSILGTIFKGQS